MRSISAVDAVSLAIQRTRSSSSGHSVGDLSEAWPGRDRHGRPWNNFPFLIAHQYSSGHGPMINSPFNLQPVQIAAIAAAVLLAILLSIVIFYLITRLRFAFFHC